MTSHDEPSGVDAFEHELRAALSAHDAAIDVPPHRPPNVDQCGTSFEEGFVQWACTGRVGVDDVETPDGSIDC